MVLENYATEWWTALYYFLYFLKYILFLIMQILYWFFLSVYGYFVLTSFSEYCYYLLKPMLNVLKA